MATNEKKAAQYPPTEVVAKATRRRFTAKYKLRILKKADACEAHGALGEPALSTCLLYPLRSVLFGGAVEESGGRDVRLVLVAGSLRSLRKINVSIRSSPFAVA
jgi:hypothetical protein